MDIQYRHQTYTVDPCSLLLRGDSFYAKITLAARVPMVVYVRVDPRLTGMMYDQPQPDLRTLDNILALTEVLGSRDPERQKSRDLYTYQLYCDIADTVAA